MAAIIIVLNIPLFFNCFCRVSLKYVGWNLFNLYISNSNSNWRVEKGWKILLPGYIPPSAFQFRLEFHRKGFQNILAVIYWPPPSFLKFQLEKGFKILGCNVMTHFVFKIPVEYVVQNIMDSIHWTFTPNFHCKMKRG